jgi:hypothetical protein
MNVSDERDSTHPALVPESREIEKLRADLADLREKVERKKKDGWDKAGIIAQIVSGAIFAALTVTVGWIFRIASANQTRKSSSTYSMKWR